MSIETWMAVPGYGGHYEASSLGRVRSLDRVVVKRHRTGRQIEQRYRGRLLTPCKTDRYGHMVVHLGVDGKKINVGVHRLVLLAFDGEPNPSEEACHNNGMAWDNRISNLRWDTHLENNRDRVVHGTYAVGEKHAMAKLFESDVKAIRETGMHYLDVVKRYGISRSQAHRICNGKAWNSVVPAMTIEALES